MSLARDQMSFAAHIRDPEQVAAPAGIEPRRMQIYRELFFNNLVDLLGGAFPVARRILGDGRWRRLVREFYARHHARTPYFLELPGEFLEWLRARENPGADEPPYLPELAHYEWVELALAVSEAEPPAPGPAPGPSADLADVPLEVSPLAWPLAYRWPVHRIGPDHALLEPPDQPTFLVVHRDATDEVRFVEIGRDVARLLDGLEASPGRSAREILGGRSDLPADALAMARAAIAELLARGALVARSSATVGAADQACARTTSSE